MPSTELCRLTLVLGGARSGKSRHAEMLIMRATPPWTYLATAQAFDREMRERIDKHRDRRSSDWRTLEIPVDIADAVRSNATGPLLLDCATLWLSNAMLAGRDIEIETDRLIGALRETTGPAVVVSNEVGLGIVPDTPLGRDFRDAQGILNQRIAAIADHVVFMAAGLPLTLKQLQE